MSRSSAAIKRRYLEAKLSEAVRQGYDGNTRAVAEALRALADELDVMTLHEVAAFIERRANGANKMAPTAERQVEDLVISHVRGEMRRLRRLNGGRLADGSTDAIIKDVCKKLGEDNDLPQRPDGKRLQIDFDRIRNAVVRGRR